jgi:hypothetical protein
MPLSPRFLSENSTTGSGRMKCTAPRIGLLRMVPAVTHHQMSRFGRSMRCMHGGFKMFLNRSCIFQLVHAHLEGCFATPTYRRITKRRTRAGMLVPRHPGPQTRKPTSLSEVTILSQLYRHLLSFVSFHPLPKVLGSGGRWESVAHRIFLAQP